MGLAITAASANIAVMILLFYLGWLLLVLAFAGASLESVLSGPTLFMSAHDLWYTFSARSFTLSQIHIERLSPILWDPILVTLLAVPAWALCGVPGVLLTWFCRPGRVLTPEEEDAHRKHAEGLFLLDELAKEARRLGYHDNDDDMAPDHSGHDAFDAMEDIPVPTDEEMMREINIVLSDGQMIEVVFDPKDGTYKDKPET